MPGYWIYWSMLTIISFGLWGFFSKITVDSMGWRNATILYTLGFVWVAPALFFLYRPSINVVDSNIAIVFALLAGAVSFAAIVGFNIASHDWRGLGRRSAYIALPTYHNSDIVTVSPREAEPHPGDWNNSRDCGYNSYFDMRCPKQNQFVIRQSRT